MILQANKISKSFRNGQKALLVFKDISLKINRGDLITITGSSGSGKSTLLNILGTLDKPDSGSLLINGKEVKTLSSNEISKIRNTQLGFVFQFHHLLPEFTAIENVLIPNQIKGGVTNTRKGVDLLGYMGLLNRLDHYPSQLSGGERLRVAVVRALINDPILIMADEPTGNLDKKNSEEVINLIFKLQKEQGSSLIIVTHDNSIATQCNQTIKLDNGMIV